MELNKKNLFLIISCLVNIVGLWVALAIQIRHDYIQTKLSAETNILNLTKAFEEHVNSSIKDIDRLLLNLRAEYREGFDHFIKESKLIKDFGYDNQLVNIAVVDKDGTIRYSESTSIIAQFDNTESKQFLKSIELRNDSLCISRPVFNKHLNKWSIQFSRKLYDKSGSFAGIVLTSVQPAIFSDFFQSVDIGFKGAVTLFGPDRYILARASGVKNIDAAIGVALSEDHPFNRKNQLMGLYNEESSVDGILRVSAFRKLPNYPLIAQVGLAEADIYIHSTMRKRNILIIGAIVSIALIGALSILIMFERKQKKLMDEVSLRDSQLQTTLTELEHLVTTDSLTGLPNRRSFFNRAQTEFTRANRYERPLSLVMIDVDHFKDVNDLHGHLLGDAALRHISGIMSGCIRESDMVARYGGEEFIIILPETDAEGARIIAERVRSEIEASHLEVDNSTYLKITVSMGIACMNLEDQYPDIDKLLQKADDAMYQSKVNGRNCITISVTAA